MRKDSPSIDIIDCEEVFNNIDYQEEIRAENDNEDLSKNKNNNKNNVNPFVLAVGGYDKNYLFINQKMKIFSIKYYPRIIYQVMVIRFWDVKQDSNNPPKIIKDAYTSDVNVMSWNTVRNHLFSSGGDGMQGQLIV